MSLQPAKKRRPKVWRCADCGHGNKLEDGKCAKCGALRPFKRAGLHKLECGCGGYVYATVAQLEQHGLPVCPCGVEYGPDEPELAFLLGLTDLPAAVEYQRRVAGAQSAQARSVGSWEAAARRHAAGTLNSMSRKVAEDMRAERRARARLNRLAAIRPPAEPMPF